MRHTSTLGIRRQDMEKYILDRSVKTVGTSLGEVRIKQASGMGVQRSKPEFDDLAAIARENNLPLRTVREAVAKEIN